MKSTTPLSAAHLPGYHRVRPFLILIFTLALLFVFAPDVSATHTPDDVDGDGYPNTVDNCPYVYNPVFDPQGANTFLNPQFDYDQDGLGDPCDSDVASTYPDFIGRDSKYIAGMGLYFLDENLEPVRSRICFTVTFVEYPYYPNYRTSVDCVDIGTTPVYRFLPTHVYNSPEYGNPWTTELRFRFDNGKEYIHILESPKFTMVAMNLNYDVVEPKLWEEEPDTDGDGIPDSEDECDEEAGPAPSGCPCENAIFSGKWRAYVSGAFLVPDNDLYYFEPMVYYCYGNDYAEIHSATVYGDVDFGLDEAALDLLGFTPKYAAEATDVQINDDKKSVEIKAWYGMCFDVTVLFDKVGLKKQIEEKFQPYLTKQMANVLRKYTGNLSGPEFSRDLVKEVDKLGTRMIETTSSAFDQTMTGPLGELAKREAVEFVTDIVDTWKSEVQTAVIGGEYANLAADQIAAQMVAVLKNSVAQYTEWCFEMWEPTFYFSVGPQNSNIIFLENRYLNPFLSYGKVE